MYKAPSPFVCAGWNLYSLRKNPRFYMSLFLGFLLCWLLTDKTMAISRTYLTNVQIVEPFVWCYADDDSILYVLVAVIFVQRNSMQGIGDTVTPLISSGIEMAGKIILAFTLVPALGYFGVILVEPIVWIVMIIPLILKVRTWER